MADPWSSRRRVRYEDITIGWICAIGIELLTARSMLDDEFDLYGQKEGDSNTYIVGEIARHKVVLACLDNATDPAAATSTAVQLLRSFPRIRCGLMVGIAGGVPTWAEDIRLGDIVVGHPQGISGGVVAFEVGKTVHDATEYRGHFNSAPDALRAAAITLDSDRGLKKYKDRLTAIMQQGSDQLTDPAWPPPDESEDVLICSESIYHPDHDPATCPLHCDPADSRAQRQKRRDRAPRVHKGLIASSHKVMADGHARDRVVHDLHSKFGFKILCFEMESMGLMNKFPCLVVRGISDYADSTKNDTWQRYASLSAAAYAKELLMTLRPVVAEREMSVIDQAEHLSLGDPEENFYDRVMARFLEDNSDASTQRGPMQESDEFWDPTGVRPSSSGAQESVVGEEQHVEEQLPSPSVPAVITSQTSGKAEPPSFFNTYRSNAQQEKGISPGRTTLAAAQDTIAGAVDDSVEPKSSDGKVMGVRGAHREAEMPGFDLNAPPSAVSEQRHLAAPQVKGTDVQTSGSLRANEGDVRRLSTDAASEVDYPEGEASSAHTQQVTAEPAIDTQQQGLASAPKMARAGKSNIVDDNSPAVSRYDSTAPTTGGAEPLSSADDRITPSEQSLNKASVPFAATPQGSSAADDNALDLAEFGYVSTFSMPTRPGKTEASTSEGIMQRLWPKKKRAVPSSNSGPSDGGGIMARGRPKTSHSTNLHVPAPSGPSNLGAVQQRQQQASPASSEARSRSFDVTIEIRSPLQSTRARIGSIKKYPWHPQPQYTLHRAAAIGDVESLKLANRSHFDYHDQAGRQLVHVAAEYGQIGVFDFLRELVPETEVADRHGVYPLHWAAAGGHDAMLAHLRALGHDLNVLTSHRASVIHYAALGNSMEMLAVLASLGQDVNARDRAGNTPLHYAAQATYQGWHMVSTLKELGADALVTNFKGQVPATQAIDAKYERFQRDTRHLQHFADIGNAISAATGPPAITLE